MAIGIIYYIFYILAIIYFIFYFMHYILYILAAIRISIQIIDITVHLGTKITHFQLIFYINFLTIFERDVLINVFLTFN